MKPPLASTVLIVLGLAARRADPPVQEPEEDRRPPWERIDVPSLVACGDCHRETWRQWSRSLHARAWTNENARTATRGFEIESCRPCHSPRSVFETGLDRPPRFRDFLHEDGVHCLSCHGLGDGVAAARTIPDAPCRPRAEPGLVSADHCYPCHEPTHSAFEEYWESRAFAEGKRCADCHMGARADGSGHDHGPNGGFSPEFVARGVAIESAREGAELLLVLRNLTGHKFPGEIPSRSLWIRVRADGAEPAVLVLRKPNKGEARPDDRLAPDEERTLRFPLPSPEAGVELEVRFLPLPLTPPESGFLLHRARF